MVDVTPSEFESEFAELVACTQAIVMTSPAAALRLGLQLPGVGAGTSVVLPAPFWALGAPVVSGLGAEAVFADVDASAGTITAQTARMAISARTRAVVADDSGGIPTDLDGIREVAAETGAAVLEYVGDAAGALYKGNSVGSHAEAAVWSLRDGPLASGSGAILTVSREDWGEYARILRRPPLPSAGVLAQGLSRAYGMYRAALGRRAAIERLRLQLRGIRGIRMVEGKLGDTGSGWTAAFELVAGDSVDRDGLVARLKDLGVRASAGLGTAGGVPPRVGAGRLPVAARLQSHGFTIRIGEAGVDVDAVARAFHDYPPHTQDAA